MLCSKRNESADTLTDSGVCPDCHIDDEERMFEIIELGREQHQKDGELEIDDDAEPSEGNDNGCYLQAWVWVDFAGTKFDKELCDQCKEPASHVIGCPNGAEICQESLMRANEPNNLERNAS